jgi:hypothetical protein
VTIPEDGKIEYKFSTGWFYSALGSGKILAAHHCPRPDKIGMMQKMAKMDMKMELTH